MVAPRRPKKTKPDPAGGGAWRPTSGYLYVALVLAAAGLGYLLMPPSTPTEGVAEASPNGSATLMAARDTQSGNEVASAWPIQATVPVPKESVMAPDTRPTYEGDDDRTPDLSSYVPRGEKPTMNQVIERLHQAGIHTGLGAFNPPGTRPPKVGLAVPDGFVLPDGYVRHHQATDDGQRIEAILMFAPDRTILDANRQPIAVPKDRVVTPELAPKGLPIRHIVIPPAVDS